MNQAILIAQSEHGDPVYWVKQDYVLDENGNYNYETYNKEAVTIFNTYFLPYLKILKISEGQTPGESPDGKPVSGKLPVIYFADGSTMQLKMGSCFDMYVDTNGDKMPNKYGRDKFIFYFCYKSKTKKPLIDSASGNVTYTREEALTLCKTSPSGCGLLLQKFDNWEFKEDYPW